MSNDLKTPILSPKVRLSESQLALYKLLIKKYETGKRLTLPECIELYTKYSNFHSRLSNGKYAHSLPMRYGTDHNTGVYGRIPMTELEIRQSTINYVFHTIGKLVSVGALTAIPNMNFDVEAVEIL